MGNVSREFIKKVLEISADEFRKAGWTKRKLDTFSLDLSQDFYGRVGLNKAVGRGDSVLEINPIVGVGSHKLEGLVAELLGQKLRPYLGAAIGKNVGYLMPEAKYRPWLFGEDTDCESLVGDMVAAIQEHGRPFMARYMDLSALCEAMGNSGGGGPHHQYRIPAACVLLGRNFEAEAFLAAKLEEIGDRGDMDAEWFRRFATKLREFTSKSG